MENGVTAIKEVIRSGICTACGACVNICPYIKAIYDKIAIIEDCGLKEGRCYDFCPRITLDRVYLEKRIFGNQSNIADVDIGTHTSIFAAKAIDEKVRNNAQYGGTVSAILAYAYEAGEIEAATLTKAKGIIPEPVIAKNKEEVFSCAKTKYFAATTLSAVNEAIKTGIEKIGVVGIPCQVSAVRNMQLYGDEEGERIKLVIGLFCIVIGNKHKVLYSIN